MELAKEKKKAFFCTVYFFRRNFFNICVSSQCIVYWIHFQNIHIFRYIYIYIYIKKLLQTLLLLVFKFAESLQCILNLCLWLLCGNGKWYLLKCSLFNFWLSPFKKLCSVYCICLKSITLYDCLSLLLFRRNFSGILIKDTLIQIWKPGNIFVFIRKYVEDFTLKHPLLFEIRVRDMWKVCLQKLRNDRMLKISLLFKKFENLTGKWTQTYMEIFKSALV